MSFIAFTFLVVVLVWARVRLEVDRRRLEGLELDAALLESD